MNQDFATGRGMRADKGFSLIELIAVVFVIMLLSYFSWQALSGSRERNAVTTVSQELKHLFDTYRQKSIDKGINYGLLFSNDGVYVFEDNGGDASDPYAGLNNFAIDSGEFSDEFSGSASGNPRTWRRVSSTTAEYEVFDPEENLGRIMIMTMSGVDFDSSRSGDPYTASGTDITSSARPDHIGSTNSPFESGTMALFFSPDGFVYLKDPTTPATPQTKHQFRLGASGQSYYLVRVAFDNPNTQRPELPNYYEIAINRYGATTKVRWTTTDGGSTWNATIE